MTKTIMNRDYLVKVKTQSNSRGTLVGFAGLVRICGSERLALHYLERVERCKDDKLVIRNKTGYELRFYYR